MTGIIKPCTEAEILQLQAVCRQTFTDTFGAANTPADLAAYLDTAYNPQQLLSELRGNQTLEIERIYILPAFKRQGLGQQFYQHAVDRARALGLTSVWLGVWEHNAAAQKFYRAMGFTQVGDHVFQLGADRQRDLILTKTLV